MRTLCALVLIAAVGCSSPPPPPPAQTKEQKPMPPPAPPPAPKPEPPKPEPERITVQHILVSFAGTRTQATRSKAEAEKLANDLLSRVKRGDDFDKLMGEFSDDPGAGVYKMSNRNVTPDGPDEYSRDKMVPAFGDVGFKLEVGGAGMAPNDPRTSPYGWHLIKRLK